jgi:hypothetical protein
VQVACGREEGAAFGGRRSLLAARDTAAEGEGVAGSAHHNSPGCTLPGLQVDLSEAATVDRHCGAAVQLTEGLKEVGVESPLGEGLGTLGTEQGRDLGRKVLGHHGEAMVEQAFLKGSAWRTLTVLSGTVESEMRAVWSIQTAAAADWIAAG